MKSNLLFFFAGVFLLLDLVQCNPTNSSEDMQAEDMGPTTPTWADILKDVVDVGEKIGKVWNGDTENLIKNDTKILVDGYVAPINANLKDMEGKLESQSDRLARLQNEETDLRQSILPDLRASIGTIRSDINSYSQSVNSFRTEVYGIEHRLTKGQEILMENMNQGFTDLDKKFSDGEKDNFRRFDQIDKQLYTLDLKLRDLIEALQPFLKPTDQPTTTPPPPPPTTTTPSHLDNVIVKRKARP